MRLNSFQARQTTSAYLGQPGMEAVKVDVCSVSCMGASSLVFQPLRVISPHFS